MATTRRVPMDMMDLRTARDQRADDVANDDVVSPPDERPTQERSAVCRSLKLILQCALPSRPRAAPCGPTRSSTSARPAGPLREAGAWLACSSRSPLEAPAS